MPLTRTEQLHAQLLELRPAMAGQPDGPQQLDMPLPWSELPDCLERFSILQRRLFLPDSVFTQSVQVSWEDQQPETEVAGLGATAYIALDRIVQHAAAKEYGGYLRSRVVYRLLPSVLYDTDYGAMRAGRHVAITRSELGSDLLVDDAHIMPLMEAVDAAPYFNTLRVEPHHEITDLAMVVRSAAHAFARPKPEA